MSELNEERGIAERAIAELDLVPNRFESWPAGPEDARRRSLSEVADSEIFILILGGTVTEPVLAEYEAARESIPDRILAFVKKVPRSTQADALLERVRHECVYKTYRTPRQLGFQVQKAIQSLMRDRLKRSGPETMTVQEETIIDETKHLDPGETLQWEFRVEEGDYINGLVDEVDGDPVNVYLLDRENYAKRKNDLEFTYHGDERVGACNFSDVYVEEGGSWFLIIQNPATVYDRELRIELTKLSSQ